MLNCGVHGAKLAALLENKKLPASDFVRVNKAITNYISWIQKLDEVTSSDIMDIVNNMVIALNEYKFAIDIDLIFDSENDFLYRNKGQSKIDNTVIVEFLPLLVKKCLELKSFGNTWNIGPQIPTYSSLYFNTGINSLATGGGMQIKTKDQDFAVSRKLFIKSSYNGSFSQ